METVIIDNIEYDPYFILGVTFDDPIEHITKEFRRKAKVLHPDKLKGEDKKNKSLVEKRTKQFKILVDCYDFVFNRKQSFNFARKNKNAQINVNTHNITTPTNMDDFNKQFEKIGLANGPGPGTTGTTGAPGVRQVEERNFEDFKREYASSEIKPKKLFNKKKFNKEDREQFNTIFEYHKSNHKSESETQLVHTTTDGFNGYNTLDNLASVANYNGLLLVDSRQTEHYSDTFKGPKNPETKEIPKDFKRSKNDEATVTLKLKRENVQVNGSGSKNDYLLQEQQFLERQREEMKQKAENDKKFIIEHQHLFDEETIRDALSDRLITSKDYTKF